MVVRASIDSYATVISVVTQCFSYKRCVTTLKQAHIQFFLGLKPPSLLIPRPSNELPFDGQIL